MFRRLASPGLLALASLLLSACGENDQEYRLPVHPTDGRVLFKGTPLPRATVRFHPTDPATVAIPAGKQGPAVVLTTETDNDGTFVLSTYVADDGIPAGDYKVTVGSPGPELDLENSDSAATPARRPAPGPGKKYQAPDTTPLTATVKPGEKNHFEFKVD